MAGDSRTHFKRITDGLCYSCGLDMGAVHTNPTKIINVYDWVTPATRYPRTTVGEASICGHYYPRGLYNAYMTGPGSERYLYWRAKRRLLITTLEIAGKTWMVDDSPHWWGIQEHATYYFGKVVVAGLGLGLIAHALATNSKVTDVTIIEQSQDVIALVQPFLPPTMRVIHADWYEWKPDCQPDGVFYDLFVGDGCDLIGPAIREMLLLKERFRTAEVFRIHGFGNDSLNQMTDFVR